MMDQTEKLNFRKAESSDVQRISALVNSAFRGESSEKGWTTEAHFLKGQRTDAGMVEEVIKTPNQMILLAESQGKLIASANLEKVSPEICYVGMIAVSPDLQAQGIGKKLLFEAERWAREVYGCRIMEMTVITIRKELIAFYERHGYQFTNEIRPFFYGDERFGIPLRKDLELGVWRKSLG